MITGEERYNKIINSTLPYFIKKYKLKNDNYTLVRKFFNDAKHMFENNSIDILHIDGNHSYEECKRDYEDFIDKIDLNKGIIIMHDIARGKPGAKHSNFGVYKLFNEIPHKKGFFLQHSGLGIITDNDTYYELIENICNTVQIPILSKHDNFTIHKWTGFNKFYRGNISTEHLY